MLQEGGVATIGEVDDLDWNVRLETVLKGGMLRCKGRRKESPRYWNQGNEASERCAQVPRVRTTLMMKGVTTVADCVNLAFVAVPTHRDDPSARQ